MKKITGVILMILGLLASSLGGVQTGVWADSPPLIITALQTGSATSASEELIILANISGQPLSVDGVRIEYLAAKPKDFSKPSRTIALKGEIAPGAHYRLGTVDVNNNLDQVFTATLASGGGHLRLVGSSGVWDLLGWGNAINAWGQPAIKPEPGQLLERHKADNVVGYQISGDNSQDFFVKGSDVVLSLSNANGLILTELLPDPAPPALDYEAEFIELQNTSNQTVHLKGLKVVIGTSTLKSFILPDQYLSPGEIIVFMASQIKQPLSNNGGRVQLRSLSDEVLDEVIYPKAVVGWAWVRNKDTWQWTTHPSPGQPNVYLDPQPKPTATKATKAKSAKKSTKKAAKSSGNKSKVKSASANDSLLAEQATRSPMHRAVIAGVGGLAVLYGAYEYRHDAINLITKLRSYRKDR